MKHDQMSPREEIEMWERRDVVIDFVCSLAIAFGGIVLIVACLL